MRFAGVVGILLAAALGTASAQDMRAPRMSHPEVDWSAVGADLDKIELLKVADGPTADPVGHVAATMARLNGATMKYFPAIAEAPVPVLLPVDTAAILNDRAVERQDMSLGDYTNGFLATPFFLSGPGGYDAVFAPAPNGPPDHNIMISGAALLYEIDEPVGMVAWPLDHELESEFPGIKRVYLENYARYAFVRYGVPYVVSMECFDGGARHKKMSCREADKVLIRFLKSLHVAGGTPQPQSDKSEPATIDRPAAQSTVFTYHGPGDLLPGTGYKGNSGRADYTVYSKIRFPFADAPAFANSQSFMNFGTCDATGRSSVGSVGGVAAYRCRVNSGQTLVSNEGAADNYSYPWRDNFCEHRWFNVGQCPGGLGHQGQDIRPANCKQRENGSRCEPYQHDVVAVRDGMLLRFPGQMAVYLVVNAPQERVRFRYLHMLPKFLDQDNVLAGRLVKEGEAFGKAGTFERRENATTYHLHFDMQVPTRYGWVFVDPYMTLIAAYERQIRGRGREIRDEVVTGSLPATSAAVTPAAPPMVHEIAPEPTAVAGPAQPPAAEAPAVEIPSAEVPAVEVPTVEAPAVEAPATKQPPAAQRKRAAANPRQKELDSDDDDDDDDDDEK